MLEKQNYPPGMTRREARRQEKLTDAKKKAMRRKKLADAEKKGMRQEKPTIAPVWLRAFEG